MISYFLHHHVPSKNRTYILVETGRAPSHPLKMVFKITVRRWETGHAPSLQLGDNRSRTFYATSRVAKYSLGMVIFRNAIFENLKCCVLGVNRVRLAGL